MSKHLYLLKDSKLTAATDGSPFVFGVKPTVKGTHDDFFSLNRKISLKNDLGWGEVTHLQKVLRGAEIWEGFPAEGLKFIFAELKAGDEDQRIDVLYLRDDGGVYPCELKIGGASLDAHGQLIRYISDLHYQAINREWLINAHLRYLENSGVEGSCGLDIARSKMMRFFGDKNIEDRHIHLCSAGIIIDEGFKSQTLKAVRYLNDRCGFSIRMLRLDAFADRDWSIDQDMYRVRIDVVEVEQATELREVKDHRYSLLDDQGEEES
jgi:hypothetical protein